MNEPELSDPRPGPAGEVEALIEKDDHYWHGVASGSTIPSEDDLNALVEESRKASKQ